MSHCWSPCETQSYYSRGSSSSSSGQLDLATNASLASNVSIPHANKNKCQTGKGAKIIYADVTRYGEFEVKVVYARSLVSCIRRLRSDLREIFKIKWVIDRENIYKFFPRVGNQKLKGIVEDKRGKIENWFEDQLIHKEDGVYMEETC